MSICIQSVIVYMKQKNCMVIPFGILSTLACVKLGNNVNLISNQMKTFQLLQKKKKICIYGSQTFLYIKIFFFFCKSYKNEFLQDFFVSIDFNNSISTLTGLDFDHYIYMYYLVLYQNFKVVDLKMHGYLGAGENMPEGYCYIPANALKHDFYMCAKQSLHLWNNKNLFVVIQIDRILARLFWIIGNALSDLTIQYHNLEERVRNLENKEIETKQKSKLYKFFHMYALRGKK